MAVWPPRPGVHRTATWPCRQQSWLSTTSSPRPLGRAVQARRPGNAELSRLPGPPVSANTALPDQTLPRASTSVRRCCVAADTPAATQLAGAKQMSPISAPLRAPSQPQRVLPARARSQAASASLDSAHRETVTLF